MRGSVSRGGVGFKGVRGARLFFKSFRTPHDSRLTPLEPRVMLDADMTTDAHRAQLIHIETDRRLGHEWDEWDGRPLPGNGDFSAPPGLFFGFATLTIGIGMAVGAALIFLLGPRLAPCGPCCPARYGSGLGGRPRRPGRWFGSCSFPFFSAVSA